MYLPYWFWGVWVGGCQLCVQECSWGFKSVQPAPVLKNVCLQRLRNDPANVRCMANGSDNQIQKFGGESEIRKFGHRPDTDPPRESLLQPTRRVQKGKLTEANFLWEANCPGGGLMECICIATTGTRDTAGVTGNVKITRGKMVSRTPQEI